MKSELYLLLLSPYSTKDQNQQMLDCSDVANCFLFFFLLMKIEIMLECYSIVKLMLVGHFLGFLNSI